MKKYVCVSCGKGFQTKKERVLHMEKMGEYHDAKCRICDNFEAETWPDLLNHFEKAHNGELQAGSSFVLHNTQKSQMTFNIAQGLFLRDFSATDANGFSEILSY